MSSPRVVVPDASVLLKWVLPPASEPGAVRAQALLHEWRAGAIDMVAPSLWRYETASVLARKAPGRASELMGALLDLDLRTVEADRDLLGEAIGVVERVGGVTLYDAAYHALALRLGGAFVTADEIYFRRARRLGGIELLTADPG